MLWISPIFKSPNKDNGYDVSDYCKIQETFGTMSDFEELIRLTSNKGMGIMLDMVFNHTSDQHEWFKKSVQAEADYSDFYIWRQGEKGSLPSSETAFFGGSVWEYHEAKKAYYYHSFDKSQPDLNWKNPLVCEKLAEVVNFWIAKGVKGFRFDAIDNIGKIIGDKITTDVKLTHQYLNKLNQMSFGKYEQIVSVGETGATDLNEAIQYTNPENNELDMVFQFEIMGLDGVRQANWEKKSLDLIELKHLVKKWQNGLFEKGWNSQFLGNHDYPRMVSRFANDSEVFSKASAKMLAAFLFCLHGTPYIYQGDELGMTNYPFESISEFNDVESINYFEIQKEKGLAINTIMERMKGSSRDNARTPMQWSDEINAGFSKTTPWLKVNPNYSRINAQESIKDTNSVYSFYKKLIQMKKSYDVLLDGKYEDLLPNDSAIFAFTRQNDSEKMTVICNFTENDIDCQQYQFNFSGSEIILCNYTDTKGSISGLSSLRPYEAMIIYG